jgi:hypothetical protein
MKVWIGEECEDLFKLCSLHDCWTRGSRKERARFGSTCGDGICNKAGFLSSTRHCLRTSLSLAPINSEFQASGVACRSSSLLLEPSTVIVAAVALAQLTEQPICAKKIFLRNLDFRMERGRWWPWLRWKTMTSIVWKSHAILPPN